LHLDIDRNFGTNPLKTAQIVHPQGDGNAMLLLPLSCQAPADTNVAIVIDDFAENGQGRCPVLVDEHF
jgi:hypothetical protein